MMVSPTYKYYVCVLHRLRHFLPIQSRTSGSMDLDRHIHLDYTLYDLYSLDDGCASNIVLVLYLPTQCNSRGTSQGRFIYGSWDVHSHDQDHTLLENILLQLRYGYMTGPIPLIFPSFRSHDDNDPGPNLDNLYNFEAFEKLRVDQRPVCKIARSPDDIMLPPDCRITVLVPTDSLLHLPHTIHPDVHYDLLSKRGLALSNLSMPKTAIIDPAWSPDVFLKDGVSLDAEIERILTLIDSHRLPFVLKMSQTFAGLGVLKLCKEEDRSAARTRLRSWLQLVLRWITPSNQHLQPCSLILQEFIQGSAVSLSLFVTRKGRAFFVACCDQLFDADGQWAGGKISYKKQPALEKEYSEISANIARFLHEKGYHGPAGADVMTDEFGNQYVVDLNVRLTGTHNLGPLRGHFTQRGLWEAMAMKCNFRRSQEAFERDFDTELRNGSMIIMGWVRNETKDHGCVGFTLGGEDPSSLQELSQKIRNYAALD